VSSAASSHPRSRRSGDGLAAVAFLTPSAISFVLFALIPTVGVLVLSTFSWNLLGAGSFIGPLQGGGIGETHGHQQVSLILVGEEGGGKAAADQDSDDGHQNQECQAKRRFPNQRSAEVDVAIRGAAEDPIEPFEEMTQRTACRLLRLQ